MKLHDSMRAQSVSRWNILETTKQQSIAEHMWATTIIAGKITSMMSLRAPGGFITYCMIHDRHEVWTGDVPTPTKRSIPGWYENVEQGIDPTYDKLREKFRHTVWDHILRCADILEGLWFLDTWGVANDHWFDVMTELNARLKIAVEKGYRNWPKHNWEVIIDVRKQLTGGYEENQASVR